MNKLFEWVDGPLIEAMTSGGMFLADEISLADDSVLERMNSLLGICISSNCYQHMFTGNSIFRARKILVVSRKEFRF